MSPGSLALALLLVAAAPVTSALSTTPSLRAALRPVAADAPSGAVRFQARADAEGKSAQVAHLQEDIAERDALIARLRLAAPAAQVESGAGSPAFRFQGERKEPTAKKTDGGKLNMKDELALSSALKNTKMVYSLCLGQPVAGQRESEADAEADVAKGALRLLSVKCTPWVGIEAEGGLKTMQEQLMNNGNPLTPALERDVLSMPMQLDEHACGTWTTGKKGIWTMLGAGRKVARSATRNSLGMEVVSFQVACGGTWAESVDNMDIDTIKGQLQSAVQEAPLTFKQELAAKAKEMGTAARFRQLQQDGAPLKDELQAEIEKRRQKAEGGAGGKGGKQTFKDELAEKAKEMAESRAKGTGGARIGTVLPMPIG